MYFLIKATTAKKTTTEPKAGRAVPKVNLKGVKLRKSPTRAVTAKLKPIEKVTRSIMSKESSRGNSVSVRQYPGRKATRMKAKMYRIYDRGVSVSGINRIERKEKSDTPMTIQNQRPFGRERKLTKFSLLLEGSSRDTRPFR